MPSQLSKRQAVSIMNREDWIRKELIPRMIECGSFGRKDMLVHNCEVDEKSAGVDHFASSAYFVELELKSGEGECECHHLLVKVQPELEEIREKFKTNVMFLNEGNIYAHVVPGMSTFLKSLPLLEPADDLRNLLRDLFPRCYFASSNNDPKNDVVVMENLNLQGYAMSPEKLILDYDHCLLALKSLGKYHALSYGMKQLDSQEFYRLATKIQEVVFSNRKDYFETDDFLRSTGMRGLEYLEERKELEEEAIKRFKEKLQNPMILMSELVKPEEPLALISHGDFCRNNILFKYDGGGNRSRPKGIKFLDFQTSRYTSPAIDLSFFLFMNTSPEIRAEHWDDLLSIYLDSLHQTLCRILGCQEVPTPYSAENIRNELKSRALYAYVLCSFFIPCMMTEKIDMTIHTSHEEQKQQYLAMGGETGTIRLADLAKEFVFMGFV